MGNSSETSTFNSLLSQKTSNPSFMSTGGARTNTTTPMEDNTVIYIMRKDLRASDNPILHYLSQSSKHTFTHLLPIYVFAPDQIEVSGFIPRDANQDTTSSTAGDYATDAGGLQSASKRTCPYPEARSRQGRFWRCGPHRAKFIAESVWSLRESLGTLGSDLVFRVGYYDEVIRSLVDQLQRQGLRVSEVWMTSEEGTEEKSDEKKVQRACKEIGIGTKMWIDEKYFIDDRDVTLSSINELPDVFTTWRKSIEPLRSRPRAMLPIPPANTVPPLPHSIPSQELPFVMPKSREELLDVLVRPVSKFLPQSSQPHEADSASQEDQQGATATETAPPELPTGAASAHPFIGGECAAHARLGHLIHSGSARCYKSTRNGLSGSDYSTKLSAYLSLGCITARQVHWALMDYESGDWSWKKWGSDTALATLSEDRKDSWATLGATGGKENPGEDFGVGNDDDIDTKLEGYGKGENEGTAAIRFELLWRDYMRLCSRKFGARLFTLGGFQNGKKTKWKGLSPELTSSSTAAPASTSEARKVPPRGSSSSGNRNLEISQRASLGPQSTTEILHRCLRGTTGQSLIDASAREIAITGYTSNRTRQNYASFLTKHLGIDWRLGAEWYECCLVDYDVSSNWANWQYVAGVGNDPRGEARIFNPVKQGFDYDPQGEYVRLWVPEVRALAATAETAKAMPSDKSSIQTLTQPQNQPAKRLEHMMQPWTTPREEWKKLGWQDQPWEKRQIWEQPLVRIDFRVEGKPRTGRQGFRRRGGGNAGGRGRKGGGASGSSGYGSPQRGHWNRGPQNSGGITMVGSYNHTYIGGSFGGMYGSVDNYCGQGGAGEYHNVAGGNGGGYMPTHVGGYYYGQYRGDGYWRGAGAGVGAGGGYGTQQSF